MTGQDWLAERFEENRSHLRAVAYRMLGSASEADDAVQEAWLRLSRADNSEIGNLGGWLTTVVGRVCLDMLRSRTSRREEPLDGQLPDTLVGEAESPEHEVLLADSVGPALQVVLETLAPAERLAFVLHDIFGVPFEEIAPIVERNPTAARQLASRARRRVRGSAGDAPATNQTRQREIVDAFLAASHGGNFGALLAVLDPNVTLRVDEAALQMGAQSGWLTRSEFRGANEVAKFFAVRRARAARPALIDGKPGVVWAQGGTARVVFNVTIADGKITAIDLHADPDYLSQLDVTILPRRSTRRER
jgi:RNA polymerase sigma-70 factor (ECF subfamily)